MFHYDKRVFLSGNDACDTILKLFLKIVDKIFGSVKIFDYLCTVIQKELKAVRRREVMLITKSREAATRCSSSQKK